MYCVTYNNGKWDKIEVKTGATNDKQVVIESGLAEGDEVVLNAWQNREKLNLPKIDREDQSGPLKNEFDNQNEEKPQGPPEGRPQGPPPGEVRTGPPPAKPDASAKEAPEKESTGKTEVKEEPASTETVAPEPQST